MRPASRSLATALVGVAMGCGTSDVPVLFVTSDAGVDGSQAGQVTTPPLPETQQAYCAGSGPPLLVDTLADGGAIVTCPTALAQRAFAYALCTCEGYVSDHALVADAFDGTRDAYDPSTATAGGSVGVNGNLHPTGLFQVGGSVWASNAGDVTMGTVDVAGDLHAQGELHPSPSLTVGGDAWLASGIQTQGDVTVKGTLHVPAGEPTDVAGTKNFGMPVTAAFKVDDPCDCKASDLVDVAGVVATYRATHDDDALGITDTRLADVQAATTLPLGCGRAYFTRIVSGDAPIVLQVSGRTAIVVDGNLSTSDFTIEAPPGSEVDLFVAGNLDVRGVFRVGDPANPARARTYVGGTSVNLQGGATLAGNLYAPGAVVTLGGAAPTTLYGSLFAQSVSSTQDLTIHFDEASVPSTACATPAE